MTAMRMKALHELVGFFDNLSGKRGAAAPAEMAAKKDLMPSGKPDADDEHMQVLDQGADALPMKKEEMADHGGSTDGVLNMDPQRTEGEGMSDEEKPKGNKIDMKELMKKNGRGTSGSKGTTFTAGHMGMGKK